MTTGILGLSSDIGRCSCWAICRILPYSQGISSACEEFYGRRLLGPREAGCGGWLPLETRCWIAVGRFAESDEIGIIGVVVLDENAFILETNDGDLVVEVFEEGGEGESVG